MRNFKVCMFAVVALSVTLVKSAKAEFAEEPRSFYTAETYSQCRNQGAHVLGGGFIGGVIGALAGRGNPIAIAGGAIAGGALGAVLSCEDKTYYIDHVDSHLSRDDYWNPYEDDHMRVIVVRSGYSQEHQHCRTYYSEFMTRDGWRQGSYQTACWDGGRWVHGFDEQVITSEIPRTYLYPTWFRERPVYAMRFRRERFDRYENERREFESERRERWEDRHHIAR
jgi:hypothetical protein